jgi:hypothetical protein
MWDHDKANSYIKWRCWQGMEAATKRNGRQGRSRLGGRVRKTKLRTTTDMRICNNKQITRMMTMTEMTSRMRDNDKRWQRRQETRTKDDEDDARWVDSHRRLHESFSTRFSLQTRDWSKLCWWNRIEQHVTKLSIIKSRTLSINYSSLSDPS